MDIFPITYWHWIILGLILISIELTTGTIVLLWLSGACIGVVAVLLIWPEMIWQLQLVWFFVFVILGMLSWRIARKYLPSQEQVAPHKLNRRNEQYVGRTFTLSEPIINGIGKIRVDDSTWRVSGEDCDLDTKVVVVAAEGMILKVEPVTKK